MKAACTNWIQRVAVVAVVLGLAGNIQASEDIAKSVVLVNCGAVDTSLFERLAKFVQSELRMPVRTVDFAGNTMAAQGEAKLNALKAIKAKDDLCLVALNTCGMKQAAAADCKMVCPPAMCTERVVRPDAGVALVQLDMVKKDLPSEGDVNELLARRLEREIQMAVCALLGMPACPFPVCALYDHANMQELDTKSRNPCPPCQEKAAAAYQKLCADASAAMVAPNPADK